MQNLHCRYAWSTQSQKQIMSNLRPVVHDVSSALGLDCWNKLLKGSSWRRLTWPSRRKNQSSKQIQIHDAFLKYYALQCFTSTIFFPPPQGPIWDVWGDRSSNGEKVKYQESVAKLLCHHNFDITLWLSYDHDASHGTNVCWTSYVVSGRVITKVGSGYSL